MQAPGVVVSRAGRVKVEIMQDLIWGYLAWRVWPVHKLQRSWCDGWWQMCFQCLEGKFGPVWVHKCVFSHVSQAPRGADKLPLMTLQQRAGLKIRFRGSIISFQRQSQTVSGVNRPVRFLEISFFVLSDGTTVRCTLAQGQLWGREGPRAR